jgi:tRNA(Ile2) C34 agmatinyltransferase TiaS
MSTTECPKCGSQTNTEGDACWKCKAPIIRIDKEPDLEESNKAEEENIARYKTVREQRRRDVIRARLERQIRQKGNPDGGA